MNFLLAVLFLILSFFIFESDAIFGSLGGGGGGCGCGMQMGGCGRKKRSIDNAPEEERFFGISSNQADMLCNSPEMKKVMVKGMRKSAIDSSKSIQKLFEEHDLYRYVVICSEAPFVYTIRHDTAYCSSNNDNHFCQAFAI